MSEFYINVVLQGVLLGGLYALFAIGLALSVGIVRLVNIAHGDLIILASYVLVVLTQSFGLPLWLSFLILVPLMAGFGYVLQQGLLRHVTDKGMLPPLLVTFGLSVIIQNGLLEGFGADTRSFSGGALQTSTWQLAEGIYVGALPALTLLVAVVLIFAIDRLIYGSHFGARLRAVSEAPATAALVGLRVNRVHALALALVGATTAVAALFMGLRMNFDPLSGPGRLIIAFEVIVLGGLGNLWGILAGAILLGVAQSVAGAIDVRLQVLAGHLVFLLIILLRPQGLFQRS
ncbi:MAG: branched-chain amino acid ABC transporter permease [Devosia sp.]|nr:branched-chain amino acid ABC transporter permease [Devosia sp.]